MNEQDVFVNMPVKIGRTRFGEDDFVDLIYSTYIGMFGKIVEILDDNYALVNVQEKIRYGKNPLTKVPICQLEKIDDSPIFTLEDVHAKMRFIMFEGTK